MARRALILGAAGFLGSHLARRLLADGWDVTGVIRDPDAPYVASRLRESILNMRVVAGDATDASLLDRLVTQADAVFPFAGHSGALQSIRRPIHDAQSNVLGHLTLLESLRVNNPSARVVFPGTWLQYGCVSQLPVNEEHPQRPRSLYALHKMTGEGYYRLYHEIHGLPTTCLRISNPYGPDQNRSDRAFGIVGTFLAAAARNETILLYGDGKQLRNYIYIDDLLDLFVQCVTLPPAIGQVFNAGGSEPTTLLQMTETVVKIVGRGRIENAPWPSLDLLVESGDYAADIGRASHVLGWRPKLGLHEGIEASWKAIQARDEVSLLEADPEPW